MSDKETLKHAPYSRSPFCETADIETSSEDYAKRFAGKVGEYFLDVQAQITLDFLKPWPKAKILDVGGGHAQLAVPLVQRGFDVTVVGSSNECRSRLDSLLDPRSFQYQSCDLLSLPFEDKSFDVVLAFRLLPHVDRWQQLIAEMCRVAKIAVIVDYPDILSFNAMSNYFFHAKKAIEGNTRPFVCFRRKMLLEEFEGYGFFQTGLHAQFFIPMAIHRAMNKVWISKSLEYLSQSLGLTRLLGSPVILEVTSVP